MSKKIIISGCTGQDGSNMADYLLANTDHQIYGMIRRTAVPSHENLEKALNNLRFQLVVGDLSDSHSLDNLIKEIKPDYFINFAAQSFVGSSWQLPEQTFDINATGVLRCLEAIRKHAPLCRFYNAGSSEEFGEVEYSPQDEKHPLRPQSPYGASKAAARHIVRVYRNSYNLFAIQGYLFNHEGPRRGQEFVTRKITMGVARIRNAFDKSLEVVPIELGNIDAKRDWSDSEDFIRGIWLMLNQEKPEEYVLSSNETHTIREFVEKAFKAAGIEGAWYGTGKDEYFYSLYGYGNRGAIKLMTINSKFYRPAEVQLLWGNSNKARFDLAWTPKISFDELVKRMVESDIKRLQ
jgi:GDPmannose 4,6-dehydratase